MMSQRYGVLPSDVSNLSINDFVFNLMVMSKGLEHENKIKEKQAKLKQRNLRNLQSKRFR